MRIIGGALGIFAMWIFEVDSRWIGALGVAWLGLAFNSIIQARNQADTAFSSVGVMLKKRWDLIPSLIDTVQRYVEHESQLLEKVVELRARAAGRALPPAEAAALDAQIGRAARLQRGGSNLQRCRLHVPDQSARRAARLPRARLLRDARRRGSAARSHGTLPLAREAPGACDRWRSSKSS